MTPGSARVLGCDYGGRRIGLAVSDPTGLIAFPLPTVEAATPKEAARRVAAAAAEAEAGLIVVGLPLLLSGEKGEQALRTEEFVELLKARFEGQVRTWDERLTSAQSERVLRELAGERRGRRPPPRKGRVDQVAATLLLQSFLDSEKSRGGA